MRDPLTSPVQRIELTLADGERLVREYTMATISEAPPFLRPGHARDGTIPEWLTNPRKHWDHPQDPVTFTADVVAGHEDEARTALEEVVA